MNRIVFASRNQGKLREIRALLADCGITCGSLDDYPDLPEIVEDGDTFLANALKKARTVAALIGEAVLADDSGLEVTALGGRPGVLSARYAGPDADDGKNTAQLLREMAEIPPGKRGAAFHCVLVLCQPDGAYVSFEGRWDGEIGMAARGSQGFGYDPVFWIAERGQTAAELTAEVKNRLSHRALAFMKLKTYLEERSTGTGRSAVR